MAVLFGEGVGDEMKALVHSSEHHLSMVDIDEPSLGSNPYAPQDVLIEVAYCGICGSDVHKWDDADRSGMTPLHDAVVAGHEICGTVCATGPGVTRFRPGDRVVCEIVTDYCGECVNCRRGRYNICLHMDPVEQRAHLVHGGGYARYIVWPERSLHKIPDSVSFTEAVLMEPTAGSVHTMLEVMQLSAGESVAILGPGARGQILLQIARSAGARPTMVTGLTRDAKKRLPLALELGAERVVNVESTDVSRATREMTGYGWDVVVENTGSPGAIQQALEIARPGGRVLISGGGIRGGVSVEINTYPLIVKELQVYGEISHVWTSWQRAIKLVSTGLVRLAPLVSAIYPITEWREAFRLAATSPDVLRVAIDPRAG